LAMEFARESNQTLIGFLRPPSFNVYAHIERVELGTSAFWMEGHALSYPIIWRRQRGALQGLPLLEFRARPSQHPSQPRHGSHDPRGEAEERDATGSDGSPFVLQSRDFRLRLPYGRDEAARHGDVGG